MTLQHWLDLCASDPAAANALCGDAMGWTRSESAVYWQDAQGIPRAVFGLNWLAVTDRNDAARMVKAVVGANLAVPLLMRLGEAVDPEDAAVFGGQYVAASRPIDLLLADPALIAWACIEALKKEEA